MKAILLSFLFSFSALAVEVSFVGPCHKKPILTENIQTKFATVGELSVHVLTKNHIPFQGSERGIITVFDTPMGDGALEVISNTEMRAYGWCYFVDNLGPDVFADEYPMDEKIKKIEWIYGFAHYKNGEWISNCTPAFTLKPKFLCQK